VSLACPATCKRLAANSFGDAKGLSPKKQRFDDEDEDENFHTAHNTAIRQKILLVFHER
jgi:hypothetical protein